MALDNPQVKYFTPATCAWWSYAWALFPFINKITARPDKKRMAKLRDKIRLKKFEAGENIENKQTHTRKNNTALYLFLGLIALFFIISNYTKEENTLGDNTQNSIATTFSSWQLLNSSDGSFSVKMPADWEESSEKNDDNSMLTYVSSRNNGTSYVVRKDNYTDILKNNGIIILNEEGEEEMLKAQMDTLLGDANGTIISSQSTSFKGFKALRFLASVTGEDNFAKAEYSANGLVFINNGFVYSLIEISNKSSLSEFENFINSFSINK